MPDSEDGTPITSGVDAGHELALFLAASGAERYLAGKVLGIGGMGEVRSFVDRATGRSVAMKTMRAGADAEALRRFAREARIQSQLEHPAVVPVYDVGTDREGAPFITMKHVRGESLAHVVTMLRSGEAAAEERYTRRKLLTVLSSVAMTIEYAHRRGVIHRDLKPDNVMLGPFGEVYVLDWGLAAIVTEHETIVRVSAQIAAVPDPAKPDPKQWQEPAEPDPAKPDPKQWQEPAEPDPDARAAGPVVDSSPRPETVTGAVLGTPGYVAPELLEAGAEATAASDVYALGAILFEILTYEPMNRGENVGAKLGLALELDGASPRERAQDRAYLDAVPPELDALCQLATRRDPAARVLSAGTFARAIEKYLDGDRDLERRRELAARATERARAAASGTADERSRALREITVALGLDPENVQARTLLVRLLTEPPPDADRLAEEIGRDSALRAFKLAARQHMIAQATYLVYVPLFLWMGIRAPWMFALGATAIAAVFFVTLYYYRHPPKDLQAPWPHLLASLIALATGEVLFGPFVLVPGIVIATGVGYLASFERRAWRVITGALAVVLVPAVLQFAAVLPPSYAFTDNRVAILPMMTDLPATPTALLLVVTHAVIIVAALLFVQRLRTAYGGAERALRLQAWQLAQLVPEDARPAVP